jgi:hypothetical protein
VVLLRRKSPGDGFSGLTFYSVLLLLEKSLFVLDYILKKDRPGRNYEPLTGLDLSSLLL